MKLRLVRFYALMMLVNWKAISFFAFFLWLGLFLNRFHTEWLNHSVVSPRANIGPKTIATKIFAFAGATEEFRQLICSYKLQKNWLMTTADNFYFGTCPFIKEALNNRPHSTEQVRCVNNHHLT